MNTIENQDMSLVFRTPQTKMENEKLKKQLSQVVSEHLKTLRKQKGLTQQQLSEKTGLHLTYIAHLESCKYHPSVFVLWKIAKVLDVPLDSFIN